MSDHGQKATAANGRCPSRWRRDGGDWHNCIMFASPHPGRCECNCGNKAPMLTMPTPDPHLPDPGMPEARPRIRLALARWRVRRWDEKVAEARAAFQASIDAGQQDYWWERQLTIALGKRALWRHRLREWA